MSASVFELELDGSLQNYRMWKEFFDAAKEKNPAFSTFFITTVNDQEKGIIKNKDVGPFFIKIVKDHCGFRIIFKSADGAVNFKNLFTPFKHLAVKDESGNCIVIDLDRTRPLPDQLLEILPLLDTIEGPVPFSLKSHICRKFFNFGDDNLLDRYKKKIYDKLKLEHVITRKGIAYLKNFKNLFDYVKKAGHPRLLSYLADVLEQEYSFIKEATFVRLEAVRQARILSGISPQFLAVCEQDNESASKHEDEDYQIGSESDSEAEDTVTQDESHKEGDGLTPVSEQTNTTENTDENTATSSEVTEEQPDTVETKTGDERRKTVQKPPVCQSPAFKLAKTLFKGLVVLPADELVTMLEKGVEIPSDPVPDKRGSIVGLLPSSMPGSRERDEDKNEGNDQKITAERKASLDFIMDLLGNLSRDFKGEENKQEIDKLVLKCWNERTGWKSTKGVSALKSVYGKKDMRDHVLELNTKIEFLEQELESREKETARLRQEVESLKAKSSHATMESASVSNLGSNSSAVRPVSPGKTSLTFAKDAAASSTLLSLVSSSTSATTSAAAGPVETQDKQRTRQSNS